MVSGKRFKIQDVEIEFTLGGTEAMAKANFEVGNEVTVRGGPMRGDTREHHAGR